MVLRIYFVNKVLKSIRLKCKWNTAVPETFRSRNVYGSDSLQVVKGKFYTVGFDKILQASFTHDRKETDKPYLKWMHLNFGVGLSKLYLLWLYQGIWIHDQEICMTFCLLSLSWTRNMFSVRNALRTILFFRICFILRQFIFHGLYHNRNLFEFLVTRLFSIF